MADPLTTNKALAQPPNAADPGTWDQPMNNNAGALDLALGGLTQLNAATLSGNVALSVAQYRPCNLVVTGAPAGNLVYQLPAGVGGFYFFQNNTTGAFTVGLGSASGGGVVIVPQGDCAVIVVDPVFGARRGDSIDTEAAGGAGQVQYNDPATGNFFGAAGMIYTASTQGLALGGPLSVAGNVSINGQVTKRLILNGGGANTRSVVIAFGSTGMAMDCSLSNVFTTTLAGNVTGAVAISNMDDGQTVNWRLQQDGTGNRTMSWPSNFRWPGGTAGVLSTGANAVDLLVATFFASSGTWLANLIKGFA
jgi:hypothetical protein